MDTLRELSSEELDNVAGGTDCCYCPCDCPETPTGPGNPGNYKPVGNAGEAPPNGTGGVAKFITDGPNIGGTNGRSGASG